MLSNWSEMVHKLLANISMFTLSLWTYELVIQLGTKYFCLAIPVINYFKAPLFTSVCQCITVLLNSRKSFSCNPCFRLLLLRLLCWSPNMFFCQLTYISCKFLYSKSTLFLCLVIKSTIFTHNHLKLSFETIDTWLTMFVSISVNEFWKSEIWRGWKGKWIKFMRTWLWHQTNGWPSTHFQTFVSTLYVKDFHFKAGVWKRKVGLHEIPLLLSVVCE